MVQAPCFAWSFDSGPVFCLRTFDSSLYHHNHDKHGIFYGNTYCMYKIQNVNCSVVPIILLLHIRGYI